ncbi:hypothetical protein B484DRAFT_118187 [Ochromonadaceae sp. CCMP2298]|nr:hypothetical protein B484DRAFT_118187 [Ochromonadaceae sp. CCMP2298]
MDLDALLEEAAELTLREISPGQEVKVHDLKRRSDLNEQLAIVQRQLQNGRLEVRIVLTGLIISISRENAAITAPAPASAAGTAVGCQTSIPISTATLSMNPSPFVWANKNFFYPFGNTPAKSLLQHIPADQACARLLLLGCGDSRHLLFSAYCAQRAGGLAAQQSLSLVMCDIIPSVMARNIVLYKLLLDGVEGAVVWSLFYSKVVDRNCVHALLTCAASLLSLGPTLAAWHDTPFGSVVRFCDEGSFRLVREVWAVYARGEVADKQKVEMFKKSQQRECEKMGYDFETNMLITAAQQATPVALMSAMKNSKEHSDLAKEYIRVGATPACIRNTGAGAGAGAGTGAGTGVTGPGTLCNPMMLEGPEQGVTLHYALDPTCGFHLAAAYLAPHTGATTAISTTGPGADDGSVDRDAIYMTCFRQFSEWGAALACMLRASVYGDSSSDTITSTGTGSGASVGRIEIWTFAGDAGDCCQAISSRCTEGAGKGTEVGAGAGAGTGSPPPFLPSHSLRPLNFHPAAPAKFDFIDSSNIGDSLGLLNVLCTCTPLLAPGLHSVISTDILSTSLANTGRVDLFLEELLHCDLATFATLTGLTLSESCLRNSCSFKHIEQNIRLLVTTQKSDSKLQRLSTTLEWHCISTQPLSPTPTPTPTPTPIPTPTPTPTLATISSPDFVALFMSIYRRMFESSMGVSCTDRAMEHLVTQMQGQNVFSKPTVQTFCRLLCAAMARCAVDVGSAGAGGCEGVGAGAGDVVVQLLEQIRFSGYLVQGQYTQEVAVWLHLLGLLSYEALETFVQQSAPLTAKGKAQFLRWWGTSTAPAAIITPTTPTTASLGGC